MGPLVSVHVPKAAGSAFQLALHQCFGNRLWLDHADPAAPPPWAACIHGHVSASARRAQFPDSPLITWVRNPVERIISHHRYWRRHPDPNHPVCQRMLAEDLGPVELAELMPHLMSELVDVDLADFSFVGVVERSELSLGVFGAMLGHGQLIMPPANASPNGGTDGGIGTAERAKIAQLCQRDQELYRQGVAHLSSTLATDPTLSPLADWTRELRRSLRSAGATAQPGVWSLV